MFFFSGLLIIFYLKGKASHFYKGYTLLKKTCSSKLYIWFLLIHAGFKELKFAVYDPCWSEAEEAVKSLDAKYTNIWNAIF